MCDARVGECLYRIFIQFLIKELMMTRTPLFFMPVVLTAIAASPAHAGIFDKTPTDGAGVYVSGFVGVAIPFDADFDGTQNPDVGVPGVDGADASIDANLDSDVYFGGAIGGRVLVVINRRLLFLLIHSMKFGGRRNKKSFPISAVALALE